MEKNTTATTRTTKPTEQATNAAQTRKNKGTNNKHVARINKALGQKQQTCSTNKQSLRKNLAETYKTYKKQIKSVIKNNSFKKPTC